MTTPPQTDTDRAVAQAVGYTGTEPLRPSSDLNDAFHALDLLGEEWVMAAKPPVPFVEDDPGEPWDHRACLEVWIGERRYKIRTRVYVDDDLTIEDELMIGRAALAGAICETVLKWKTMKDEWAREDAERKRSQTP